MKALYDVVVVTKIQSRVCKHASHFSWLIGQSKFRQTKGRTSSSCSILRSSTVAGYNSRGHVNRGGTPDAGKETEIKSESRRPRVSVSRRQREMAQPTCCESGHQGAYRRTWQMMEDHSWKTSPLWNHRYVVPKSGAVVTREGLRFP